MFVPLVLSRAPESRAGTTLQEGENPHVP
jgi:hypothetical protein